MCGGLILSPIPTFATPTPTVSAVGGSSYSDPTRNPVWQEIAPPSYALPWETDATVTVEY